MGRWVTIEHEHIYLQKGEQVDVDSLHKGGKPAVEKAVKDGTASRMFQPDGETRVTDNTKNKETGKRDHNKKATADYAEHKIAYDKRVSAPDKMSVAHYTGKGYREMNARLRAQGASDKTFDNVDDRTLQRVIDQSPQTTSDQIVYRHFDHDPQLTIGETAKHAGFLSTSTISQAQFMFNYQSKNYSGFGYEIAIPKGSNGVLIGHNKGETEVTFGHGSQFKVLGKSDQTYEHGASGETHTRTIYKLAYMG